MSPPREVVLSIGLIDADRLDNNTRHPNLALMKISSYCKRRGQKVELLFKEIDLHDLSDYDIIIISKVFTFTGIPDCIANYLGDRTQWARLNKCIVELLDTYRLEKPAGLEFAIGGTGFFDDGGRNLHYDIEHIMPDYSLYAGYVSEMTERGIDESYFSDYSDYSIGFMTRGCFRKCPFCVNKKYDRSEFHAHLGEFLNPDRPRIYLWDDNVLACTEWRTVFDELDAADRPFQFRQGLDLRLMTDEKACRISESRCYGDMIFAFDNLDDYSFIEKKLVIWRRHSKRTTKLYVLCAFDPWLDPTRFIKPRQEHLRKMYSLATQDERDQLDIEGIFKRIELLMRFGCLPYIMRYQNYKQSKYRSLYVQIARWCNQPQFFKKKSFAEFCIANQDYAKTERYCSAYQAYLDFSKECPDIAGRYFHMKYEQRNGMKIISSFGRAETIPCICCNHKGRWDEIQDTKDITREYFSGEIDQLCLYCRPLEWSGADRICELDSKRMASKLCKAIIDAQYEDIIKGIDAGEDMQINSSLIPQLNNIESSYREVIDYFNPGSSGVTFEIIGSKCISSGSNTKGGNTKYGECQAKLLMMTDLLWKDRSGIKLTPLGEEFQLLNMAERDAVFQKLILKIPLVQYLIRHADREVVDLEELLALYLNKTTLNRRIGQLRKLMNKIEGMDPELDRRLSKVI